MIGLWLDVDYDFGGAHERFCGAVCRNNLCIANESRSIDGREELLVYAKRLVGLFAQEDVLPKPVPR